MDSTTAETFRQIADRLEMKPKLMYSIREVALVSGVPYDTLLDECKAGRLKSYLPPGHKQRRVIRPEWVDEWIERGTHGGD